VNSLFCHCQRNLRRELGRQFFGDLGRKIRCTELYEHASEEEYVGSAAEKRPKPKQKASHMATFELVTTDFAILVACVLQNPLPSLPST
jgi:hypothetical protein